MNNPNLILVRGLGGSGKTTLSTNLPRELRIPVLNRDDIKPAIRGVSLQKCKGACPVGHREESERSSSIIL